MTSFLFEQYGYYPNLIDNNMFFIDDWCFKLIEIDFDIDYINGIDEYLSLLKNMFPGKGAFIIKNRANEKITFYDGKKYVLISIKKGKVNLSELNRFHFLLKEDKTMDLNELVAAWEQKMSFIENQAMSSIRMDSVYYDNNLEISMYCLGLFQNAIQYLSDIVLDYGEKINDLTINHKRLYSLDAIEFFNPFNFVVDHPCRDLIELYKNNVIDFNEFEYVMEFYQMNSQTASLMLARLLYPSYFVDELEKNYYSDDKNLKLEFNIEKEILKIKKVYFYLKNKYTLRPIVWLESN